MMNTSNFYWAVGIENTFIPQTRAGLRSLDEYELTQHYELWREDIDRVASLGVSHIRWGIPWYRVNPAPGRYHWEWVDEVLEYLLSVPTASGATGIQPIIDLVHYGTPWWMENAFLNSSYPQRVAEYAYEFASRYQGRIRFYTPLNEPTVNADICGRVGQWPPYLHGADGYVKLIMQIARGMVLTAQALRQVDPDVVLIQVEALGWMWSKDPRLDDMLARTQAHHYLAVDLITGRMDDQHLLWRFLLSHGVTEQDITWLNDRAARLDVLGVNFYPWSGGEVFVPRPNRRSARSQTLLELNFSPMSGGEPVVFAGSQPRVHRSLTGLHLAQVLREAWERYHIPLMVTETSAKESVAGRARWMDETITAVREVQAEGIPVVGYTWFPVFTMIDWAYRMGRRPLVDYLLHLGLWDSQFDEAGVLQRYPTGLVNRYRNYVLDQVEEAV